MKHSRYNKMAKATLYGLGCLALVAVITSCQKYLEKKPSDRLKIPNTLADCQALLDNSRTNDLSPSFMEFVADDFYSTYDALSAFSTDMVNIYKWDPNAKFGPESTAAWGNPYSSVASANFVLDLLPDIPFSSTEQAARDNVEGTALFSRAIKFFEIAQLFCKPYSNTAATDLGIVIRLTSDIETPVARSSVKETYDRIIADLVRATQLLPVTALYNSRPNKAAAHGVLARVYLSMREYDKAGAEAAAALQYDSRLLDYNTLTPAGDPQMPETPVINPEVLFILSHNETMINIPGSTWADSTLYRSYHDNDLRQDAFYGIRDNKPYFKGSYFGPRGTATIFTGPTISELYLVRAETYARAGNATEAMNYLNALLRKRWKTGTFTDMTATDANDALEKILVERRKELVFRGQRWTDLRRFNLEGRNITLKRILNNVTYTLPPNDLRWVLLIPDVEIARSGIPQNPR